MKAVRLKSSGQSVGRRIDKGSERDGPPLEQVAAVQTRAMEAKEKYGGKDLWNR